MKKRVFSKRFAWLCAVVFVVILILWTVWGNTALMISMFTISSARIPAVFSGFRIVQVSDLHNAEFGEGNAELLQRIAECAPDIIVITGDLVDARHTNAQIALDFVEEAVRIAPVYYVPGNHEANLPEYDELTMQFGANGAIVLEDTAIKLERGGETIALAGLTDPRFAAKETMLGAVPDMMRTKLEALMTGNESYTILLSHRPEHFDTYVHCGVDLVFSGHAHGGQFRLPLIGGLIAPDQGLFPQYDSGMYTDGVTNMVVSRGLGNSILPVRFNNRPEIVLAELHCTDPEG